MAKACASSMSDCTGRAIVVAKYIATTTDTISAPPKNNTPRQPL